MNACSTTIEGSDRVDMRMYPDAFTIALADTGGNAMLAERVVDRLLCPDFDWDELGDGTNGILLRVHAERIRGEHVGNAAAWLFHGDHATELTAQRRFKLAVPAGATLVVASDGLWRHAKPADIAAIAQQPNISRALSFLVELVRLPDRSLRDDVAIAIAR